MRQPDAPLFSLLGTALAWQHGLFQNLSNGNGTQISHLTIKTKFYNVITLPSIKLCSKSFPPPPPYSYISLHNEELHNLNASPNIYGDQINEDEIGTEFSTHGRDEKCIQNCCRKTWRE